MTVCPGQVRPAASRRGWTGDMFDRRYDLVKLLAVAEAEEDRAAGGDTGRRCGHAGSGGGLKGADMLTAHRVRGGLPLGENKMLRFLPGAAGAAGAFIVFKLIARLEFAALWIEVLIYAAVYIAVTVAVDRAMVGYGRNR